jgi:hypothetical protein
LYRKLLLEALPVRKRLTIQRLVVNYSKEEKRKEKRRKDGQQHISRNSHFQWFSSFSTSAKPLS